MNVKIILPKVCHIKCLEDDFYMEHCMKNSKHIPNQFQDKASMWRGLYIMYNCTKCKVVMDELQLVIPPDTGYFHVCFTNN